MITVNDFEEVIEDAKQKDTSDDKIHPWRYLER